MKNCILPENIDFSDGSSFCGTTIIKVNFSKTNIKNYQWFSSFYLDEVILPIEMANGEILLSNIKDKYLNYSENFSRSDKERKDLINSLPSHILKLATPNRLFFLDSDIHYDIDPADILSLKKLLYIEIEIEDKKHNPKSFLRSKGMLSMNFKDCFFKDKVLNNLNLYDTNITTKQLRQVKRLSSCILPKSIDPYHT